MDAGELGPFVDRVCADGIAGAKSEYPRLDEADKLKGAIEGFELCQGIEHTEHLLEALHQANARAVEAFADQAADLCRWRTRVEKIEWVCNVVSAALVLRGLASLGPLWPTGQAVLASAALLGTRHGRVWRIRG
jgi:hypothetical protein